MKASHNILLVVTISLIGCAKPPTTRIAVNVPETYSGYIRVEPCLPGAHEPAVLDELQTAITPVCPPGDAEI